MDLPEFRQPLDRVPSTPGIYIMKDAAGATLYIGKARNLRARVRSYFTDPHDDRPHIRVMLGRLRHIDWIVTNNETEALILEANCVRKEKPPFNVLLKDDKHFPYLKVTVDEAFPRLLVARRVEEDGAGYFGPYTDGAAVKRLMLYARKAFKLRDCSRALPLSKPVRPCINYSIARCSGACAGKISEEDYRENVQMLVRFLRGRRTALAQELRQKMAAASERMRYEDAARYRDQLRLVTDVPRLQQVDLKTRFDCDVVGLSEDARRAGCAVLYFREGVLMAQRTHVFGRREWELAAQNPETVFVQIYLGSQQELPDEILVPASAGFDTELLQEWFLQQYGKRVRVKAPVKGTGVRLVELAAINARSRLLHYGAADYGPEAVLELQRRLNLPRPPRVIEAFDVSNLGASFAVAGKVQFVNGSPETTAYRRYSIRTVAGQDDFAMMMEAVERRLNRLGSDTCPAPDLLLIDGGRGQLGAALKPLKKIETAPMIAALAKKEELLFSPYAKGPVHLEERSLSGRLIRAVRDEAHRWALAYHRTKRGKQFRHSKLEEIPGIGPVKARELLKKFGSVKRIIEAPVERITAVRGITEELAGRIKADPGI
jgi:excinuclease ABC subunit C